MVGVLLVGGCSGRKAESPSAPAKPALVVPKEFSSAEAKQEFVANALADDYYAEVEPLLIEAVTSNPADAESFARLGTVKYMLNRFDEAAQAWGKAAELDPARASEMHNNAGNAMRDGKRLEEAKAAYRKALELEPTRWSAAVNLADLLRSEGNLSEALKTLEAAIAANPQEQTLKAVAATYKQASANTN